MFYYAEIDSNYKVINTHSLSEASTNPNYIPITEELYNNGNDNGELVGQYYNTLLDIYEIIDMDWEIGKSNWVNHKGIGMPLSTKIDNMDVIIANKADIDHTHSGYATADHVHTGYVSSDDLQVLEDVVDTKADATHTHSEYAPVSHSHTDYALQTSLDVLGEEVDGKADATHSHTEYALSSHEHDYALSTHSHDTVYAPISHSHSNYVTTADFDALEAEVDGKASSTHTHTASEIGAAVSEHNHDTKYALVGHGHDEDYSAIDHVHTDYATVTELNTLSTTVSGKANTSHTHGDLYYTEDEIDTKLADKADSNHNHAGVYDVNGSAASALSSANTYTDSKINGLASEDYVDEKVSLITIESLGALPNTTVIPTVPTNVSAFTNDVGYLTEHQSLNGLATETYVDTRINAINIPYALSDLTTDSTHRVVTDAEKATWNAKSNFSGSYNDLTNKPSIPSISGLATETYVDEAVSTKANSSHTHTIANVSGLQSALNSKSDSAHNHNSSYDVFGAANSALASAQTYTDEAIDLLSETVSNKADSSTLTSHTGNTTAHITSTERTNWNVAKTHANSAHAPSNAEENQNAFSNIVVGNTTISADTKTDTLTFVAGNNVTITPDATGDSITISSTNTVYTHPTSAGNKHIPVGGSSGQILRWSADGTAVWGNENNTTYGVATQTSSGLMSDTDKVKLDGIAEGANNYTLPSAGTSLGGVKSGGDVTISGGLIAVNDDSHNHVISNIDGLQSALDSKAATGHIHSDVYTETEVDTLLEGKANASHTHSISNITNLQTTLDGKAASSHGTHVSYSTTVPVMDGTASVGSATTVSRSDHKHPTDTSRAAKTEFDSHTSNKSNPHGVTLAQLGVTATATELNVLDGITATVTELNYVDGVTSNIQTQLDGKSASGHTHNYAGSSSAGGAATSANKLNTDAGSATQPVYFANGIPVKTTYTLAKSVPADAKFTDTTYGASTSSANGLMSASDKAKLDGMVLATVSEVENYLGI